MLKLNDEQKKQLKLFSFYCMGYGAEEVTQYQYIYNCGLDYINNDWMKGFGAPIEGYPEINNMMEGIYEYLVYNTLEMDCDLNGELKVSIDCKERKIEVTAYEFVFQDSRRDDSIEVDRIQGLTEDEIISLDNLFDQMTHNGFKEGVVTFDGSGDSGQIYEDIEFDGEFSDELNNYVLNVLYKWLGRRYGGWELNEGSHGKFIFHFDGEKKMIYLEFNEVNEVSESLGQIFYSEF